MAAGWLQPALALGVGTLHYPGKQHHIAVVGQARTPALPASFPRRALCSQGFWPRPEERLHLGYRGHPLVWGSQRAKGCIWGHKTSSPFVVGWERGRRVQPTGRPHVPSLICSSTGRTVCPRVWRMSPVLLCPSMERPRAGDLPAQLLSLNTCGFPAEATEGRHGGWQRCPALSPLPLTLWGTS